MKVLVLLACLGLCSAYGLITNRNFGSANNVHHSTGGNSGFSRFGGNSGYSSGGNENRRVSSIRFGNIGGGSGFSGSHGGSYGYSSGDSGFSGSHGGSYGYST